MKIYATTRSERAIKGQGGNEFLDIVITDEKQQPLIKLVITPEGNEFVYSQKFYTTRIKEKGKSQKGSLVN